MTPQRFLALACMLAIASDPAVAQYAAPDRAHAMWKSTYEGCFKSTGAPESSRVAKGYCECAADKFMALDFDDRMTVVSRMQNGSADDKLKERLDALYKSCLTRATEAPAGNPNQCPSATALAAGFTASTGDGRTVLRVRPLTPSTNAVETIQDGKWLNTIVYTGGLFPVSSAHRAGFTAYEYKGSVAEFAPEPGASITYTSVARTSGKPENMMTSEMRVVGQEEFDIGGCSYPVAAIERTNDYEQAGSSSGNLLVAYFSPRLKIPLRTRMRWRDGHQQDFTISKVEALP